MVSNFNIQIGIGRYVRPAYEPLILCVRKSAEVLPCRQPPGIIAAPKTGHSVKPAAAYDLIETVCDGPQVEPFARGRARYGWCVWGEETGESGYFLWLLQEPRLLVDGGKRLN